MALHGPPFQTAIAGAGAIPQLVACLKPINEKELQVQAAFALACIEGNNPVNASAVAAGGGLEALVACLRAGCTDRLVEAATGALRWALLDEATCRAAATAGAIPALLNGPLQHNDDKVQALAADALVVMAASGREC
jgi:hypothetical protein